MSIPGPMGPAGPINTAYTDAQVAIEKARAQAAATDATTKANAVQAGLDAEVARAQAAEDLKANQSDLLGVAQDTLTALQGTLQTSNSLSEIATAGTQAVARANLGAAKAGANSDITSLTGLTTPLSQAQGGLGAGSLGAALMPFLGPQSMALSDRLGNVVDIREWNGVDVAFNHANDSIVAKWLAQAMAAGVPAYAPPGIYAMADGVELNPTADLEINLPRAAIFKSASALSRPILNISDAGGSHRFGLTLRGGQFDNALGVFQAAAQSNTSLALTRLARFSVGGTIFKGAATYGAAGLATDSGITAADCYQGTVALCFFDGQGDACLYFGGNNDPGVSDDGGPVIVALNHFSNSQQAFAYKRQGAQAIFALNSLRNMYSGVNTLETGNGTTGQDPGRSTLVAFNTARFIETSFARFDAQSLHKVIGNEILDFGYMPDGVTVSAAPVAVNVRGSAEVDISHNTIGLDQWAQAGGQGSTSHVGIGVSPYTYLGSAGTVTATPDFTKYSDNIFKNIYTAVREYSATAADGTTVVTPGPTFGISNSYVNVTARLTALNAASGHREFDTATGGERTFYGNTEATRSASFGLAATGFRTFLGSTRLTGIFGATTSLAFGTIAAGAYASDQTATVTGAAVGDYVEIAPNSAAAMPAGLELRGYVFSANTVTVRAKNGNASGSLNMATSYSYNLLCLRQG